MTQFEKPEANTKGVVLLLAPWALEKGHILQEDGLTGYLVCTGCGAVLKDTEPLEATMGNEIYAAFSSPCGPSAKKRGIRPGCTNSQLSAGYCEAHGW